MYEKNIKKKEKLAPAIFNLQLFFVLLRGKL